MIEKYFNKNIDDKKLISIKSNLIYWFECWLFDFLQLTNIEIYLYSTIYEMNNFDVELDSYLSRSHVVRWISRDETLRESFSRTFVLKSLAHFVIRSLRVWAWSLKRWVRLIEDLAETIEQALLDLKETMRWLDVTYPYSGRGRNRYLRSYCNYQQNDWSDWLSMIEFVFNAVISAFIELFAFMTNYEFESRMSFDSFEEDISKSARERVLSRKNSNIIEKMKDIWNFTKKKLANAQDIQKRYVDQKRTFSSEYEVEDMIWLFTKNIKIERSSRKLNHKWIESYKIKKIIRDACQLDLSQSMKIHDIFHIFLLRKTAIDSFIEQI
jgi:hypothetical protein